MEVLDIFIRALIACLCGLAIGSEREIHHRSAGLKTNALVALGACTFTLFDLMNNMQYGSDLRASAQIVSGIGFLGGGAILKDGFNIKGLTTAAALWCSAAVGMLVGAGYIGEAAIIALLVMTINTFLRPLVRVLGNVSTDQDEYLIKVSCDVGNEATIKKLILEYIENKKLTLKDIKIHKGLVKKQDTFIDVLILSKKNKQVENIAHKIAKDANINTVNWDVFKS